MRLKLTIAYDGSPFLGWQSQAHGKGIQDYLERALFQLTGTSISLHGAGRTDRGVHALAQVAHCDLPQQTVSKEIDFKKSLNALLPPTIRILEASPVSEEFHARFSATGKVYRYLLWHSEVLPPFLYQRAWHIYGKLNLPLLEKLLQELRGEHDFRGFTARSGGKRASTIRTIKEASLSLHQEEISLIFSGNGFLYHMVRMLVGAAIRVAQGRMQEALFYQRLHYPAPPIAPFTAPAAGLYLVKVDYNH